MDILNAMPAQHRGSSKTTPIDAILSMRRFRIALPLLVALLFCAPAATQAFSQPFAPASPEEAGVSSERLARIDAVLEEYIEQERLPGAALVIGRRGHVVYARRSATGTARRRNRSMSRIFFASLRRPRRSFPWV